MVLLSIPTIIDKPILKPPADRNEKNENSDRL